MDIEGSKPTYIIKDEGVMWSNAELEAEIVKMKTMPDSITYYSSPPSTTYPDQYFVYGPWHGRKRTVDLHTYGNIFIPVPKVSFFNSAEPDLLFENYDIVQYAQASRIFEGIRFDYWVPTDRDPREAFTELALIIMKGG